MATRQSTDRRTINRERELARRERDYQRKQARYTKQREVVTAWDDTNKTFYTYSDRNAR